MRVRNSLSIFLAVLKALFLREIGMRITVGKSGLFWTFFEPFFQVFIYIALHVAVSKGHNGTSHYSYVAFIASGFIAFDLFRQILNKSTGAFQANRGLFAYKQVKPIDTIISRVLVEIFLKSIVIITFLLVGFFLDSDNILPKNTLMVFFGYFWIIIFAFSIGLLVAVGNIFFISIGKFIGIISFLLLFLSAVFFPIVSIPPVFQDILLFNPLVHFMEMIHGYYIYGLDDRFVDYNYIFIWTIAPLSIGLWLYYLLEKRILSSDRA